MSEALQSLQSIHKPAPAAWWGAAWWGAAWGAPGQAKGAQLEGPHAAQAEKHRHAALFCRPGALQTQPATRPHLAWLVAPRSKLSTPVSRLQLFDSTRPCPGRSQAGSLRAFRGEESADGVHPGGLAPLEERMTLGHADRCCPCKSLNSLASVGTCTSCGQKRGAWHRSSRSPRKL